ncbi:hypothetical protein [Aerosakkonema funiforme]|uniref:hypothetical protein n=1 Tax=Aerosakkonema funiforme TaxID=1246630 RepID=UPI0035BA4F3C
MRNNSGIAANIMNAIELFSILAIAISNQLCKVRSLFFVMIGKSAIANSLRNPVF